MTAPPGAQADIGGLALARLVIDSAEHADSARGFSPGLGRGPDGGPPVGDRGPNRYHDSKVLCASRKGPTMQPDQLEDLIRRNDVGGLVDALWVLAVARACGVSEAAVQRARNRVGYTRTVQTPWTGLRWAMPPAAR
jgi:hypothetical protein